METVDVGTAQIAFAREGSGPPLLLMHGWPLSGATWRKVLPRLKERFTCIVPDSPGLGETRWSDAHDFGFVGQANAYARFVEQLGFTSFHVLAHDTGATLARQLSLLLGPKVKKLVILDTEIPGHRPPFIPLFQNVTRLPGSAASFRLMLRSKAFIRSPMGFGGVFVNKDLLSGEFHDLFIAPLIRDARRMEGVVRYLQGIDWAMVDGFAQRHAEIQAKTLLVWGHDDPIFPIARAMPMVGQLRNCVGLEAIAGAVELVPEKIPDPKQYPFSIPAIRALGRLELNPKVTFFVGENGSGKSTLIEAIAVAAGFNAEGGSRNFNFSTRRSESNLHTALRLARGTQRPKTGYFLRAESFFNVATAVDENPDALASHGGKSLHEQSHGESFMSLVNHRFGPNGLYLLDEPEAALSPQRQLALLRSMHDLVEGGNSQFVIATHSPILLAYPGATLYFLGPDGIEPIAYEQTEHYALARAFLLDHQRYLTRLFEG